MILTVNLALILMLLITAVAIVRVRHLFAVVMLGGIFSLLSAGLYVALDAVDVAFTEAAVGAGISTVLMLGTMTLTRRIEKTPPKISPIPLLVSIATGATMMWAVADMPAFGDPNAPAQVHIAPEYIAGSRDDISVPNIVTSVLASYRGYDTLGEVAVIFTAGIGVTMLLMGRRPRRPRPEASQSQATPPGGETGS